VFAPASKTTSTEPGASVRGAVDVPAGATGLRIAVLDSSGQIVRSIDLEGASGLTDFVWDGKTEDGAKAPEGTYSFQAIASVGGQRKPLDTLLAGRVDSVTIDAAGKSLLLNTPIGTLQLADVRRVM
jgi:flagellar basal-body rod modification protein FlgD